jgi:hypothetical protein
VGLALDRFLGRFENPIRDGKGWRVLCPAHDDQSPSLHIEESADGTKVLVTCRAGCALEQILSLAGATTQELFESHWSKSNGSHEGRATTGTRGQGRPPFDRTKIVSTYDYVDEQNRLLFQVVRDIHKNFVQRRPSGKDPGLEMWNYSLEGTRRVLYKLPDVVAARRMGFRIYVVEGEKDANTLAALGLIGTTAPQGAGKWMPQYTDQLAGAAEVVILPDNDDPGRKHADQIRDAIAEWVSCVKVLPLPGLEEKSDVSDWIAKGGTKESLEQLATDAPAFITPAQRLTSVALPLGSLIEKVYTKPRSLLGTGIISAGDLFYLYGRPGIGKTYATLQMILELAKGNGIYGLAGPEGGPIRIGVLELELTAYWFKQRILQLIGDDATHHEWIDRIQIVARPELQGAFNLLTDDWKALHRWCKDAALDLVFVDALSRAHTTDENKGIEFGVVLQRFDDLRFSTNTAVGLIHHEPKTADSDSDDMNALRGHSRMQSDPNTLIRLVKIPKSPFFQLRFPKANNAPDQPTVWLVRRQDGGFDVTQAPAEKRQGNVEKVRQVLEEAGAKGVTLRELEDRTSLKHGSLVGDSGHLQAVGAMNDGEAYTVTDKRGRARVWRKWRLPQMSDVTDVEKSTPTSANTLPSGDME